MFAFLKYITMSLSYSYDSPCAGPFGTRLLSLPISLGHIVQERAAE